MISFALVAITSVLLSGCMTPMRVYSTHNLEDGGEHFFGGGGYRVTKLKPGTYEIKVITKRAKSMHPKTARKMWRDHAERVCGGGDYIEEGIFESEVHHEIYLDWDEYQNVREGRAICH